MVRDWRDASALINIPAGQGFLGTILDLLVPRRQIAVISTCNGRFPCRFWNPTRSRCGARSHFWSPVRTLFGAVICRLLGGDNMRDRDTITGLEPFLEWRDNASFSSE